MANVKSSRFALLKIEDDYDSDEKHSTSVSKQSGQKKSDKQKQGTGASLSQAKKKANQAKNKQPAESTSQKGNVKSSNVIVDKQWEEWAKQHEQYVDGAFEKELHEALVTSKLQYEEMKKQNRLAASAQNGSAAEHSTAGAGKKKRKKDKPVVMSLEQFSQANLEKRLQDDNSDESSGGESRSKATTSAPSVIKQTSEPSGGGTKSSSSPATGVGDAGDSDFFERVNADVRQIVKKEQRQQEFKKQYEIENVQTGKLKKDLDLRDKEIVMLRTTTKKLEDELQQVKKRNQQLCHILGQGEMKDKTALLLELDELRQVRDDLTQEVTRLTSDLEKERSKVHTLKTDADKAKGGKHGSK